jgi:hypothetical protein
MRPARNDMLNLWQRIAARPLGAKMVAGVLLAGIFSLMASPEVLDHGKAAATSLTKPVSSEAASKTEPNRDCSSDHRQQSEPEPLP